MFLMDEISESIKMSNSQIQSHWRIHRGDRETCPPYFKPRKTVIQRPPLFDTQRYNSMFYKPKSISLPAYACKSDNKISSQNAPKLVIFSSKIKTNFSPQPFPPVKRKHPFPTPQPPWRLFPRFFPTV